MAMILITHDLGVVAGIADRIHVMYAGHIVESSPVNRNLFRRPSHPYTMGLIGALPRLDTSKRDTRLIPIPGQPPDLIDPPRGCPFFPRCSFRVDDRCADELPSLREVAPDHSVACFYEITETDRERWRAASSEATDEPDLQGPQV
jgi:oligopeptide transport system ATP-binding protein